jgi:hypothetical protein
MAGPGNKKNSLKAAYNDLPKSKRESNSAITTVILNLRRRKNLMLSICSIPTTTSTMFRSTTSALPTMKILAPMRRDLP